MGRPIKNETGKHYGRLRVLAFKGINKRRAALWKCKCECGKQIIVPGYRLRNGETQSCGCLHKEVARNLKTGRANPLWAGDDPNYKTLHQWINRNKKKCGYCVLCKSRGYTGFANISHTYKRNVNDFVELCINCHNMWDKKGETECQKKL